MYFFSQGKTSCVLWEPCNENRFFPVLEKYTGKTLFWPCTADCSAKYEQLTHFKHFKIDFDTLVFIINLIIPAILIISEFYNNMVYIYSKPLRFIKYPESNFLCASSKSRPVEVEHGQKTSKQCNDVNLMSSCFFWVRFKFILYPDPWESTIAFLF